MRAGRRSHLITIQGPATVTQSASGEETTSWGAGVQVWAERVENRGGERFTMQVAGRSIRTFRFLSTPDVEDISTLWRIVDENGHVYNLTDVRTLEMEGGIEVDAWTASEQPVAL